KVDLIIGPTSPTVALKIGEWEKNPMFGETQDVLVEPNSLAGLPGISINCGYNKEGLPVGLQIFGPQKSEELILRLADQLEQWQK
ncbi:MAG: Asp-tRNA(Asn)/Glu-tRNA(Gln) amidotransferase GatCAB subunit A, partial [Candidatus Nealsonbacteria bacterium CG18_big_fil_WC_8_21_14_2_50_37_10]